MRIDILTLFPEMVAGALGHSIVGRAVAAGRFQLGIHNIRSHGAGRHRTVDDTPYGGGAGMVLRADVVAAAVRAVQTADSRVILMDPSGVRFDQAAARRLSEVPHLILLCGHYEGIDERVREALVDEVISLGDFVLTGGELAAAVVVEATVRLIEYPQYTRPVEWEGRAVPEILRSGDHGKVAAWRRQQALERTARWRPDLHAAWAAAHPPGPVKARRKKRAAEAGGPPLDGKEQDG
jgi:tRNA (guanine37-N1)-methyltransferase